MKNLFLLCLMVALGWFAWKRFGHGGAPLVIEHPIYGEMRAGTTIANRDIEMAIFVRMESESLCHSQAEVVARDVLRDCPSCTLQPAKCQATLPPRYARMFDDVPIASPYVSMTAANSSERDARLVVYGLTDAEGQSVCEVMRAKVKERYTGEAHCVFAAAQ
jgi:hypothetical protein